MAGSILVASRSSIAGSVTLWLKGGMSRLSQQLNSPALTNRSTRVFTTAHAFIRPPPPPPIFPHWKNWYRECTPPRLSAPPPPIFPHWKNWYRECAPPRLSAPPPPFSERPLSRHLASDERPPSRYLASDSPTMHNEVPKCAWHLSGNEADYSLGLQGTRDAHGMIVVVLSCLRSCSRSPMEGVQTFL